MNNALTRRLATYKTNAAKHKQHYPSGPLTTWKNNRYPRPAILLKSDVTRSQDKTKFFLNDLENFPGNLEGPAHKIIRMDHTGWFTDTFRDGVLTGAVVSIRHPHKTNEDGSHLLYLPATEQTDFDCCTVYNEFHDTKEEAARAADYYAEREAESCREEDAKFQAGLQTDDLKAELHDLNRETLALIKEVKAQGPATPAICKAIKNAITNAIDERARIFKRIDELTDNYWTAVENW